ncbi:MAG: hypothetical protein LBD51_09990 [Bifidobacteriaceae bacterium]|nr:hypothetical protein [Bifidobacteriaceae bacterium]
MSISGGREFYNAGSVASGDVVVAKAPRASSIYAGQGLAGSNLTGGLVEFAGTRRRARLAKVL